MNIIEPADRQRVAEAIQRRIRGKDAAGVRDLLGSLHIVDASAVVSSLPPKEQKSLFALLPAREIADLIELMRTDDQVAAVSEMPNETAAKIIEEMAPDEAADVLAGIPEKRSREILSNMKPEDAQEAKLLLSYPEDSAGALMSPDAVALPEENTIEETIRAIRKSAMAQDPQRSNYVYVTSAERKLVGVLQLRDLVTHDPKIRIREIMRTGVVQVAATTERHEVARIFRQYNLAALPVTNTQGTFLGIITADDAAELIHEIATEEMLKLEGISLDESRDMPWWKISRRRVGWLSLNILLNVIAASVIAFYQDTLRAVIAIAVFLPIISDMSGCSGMQAVAVSIRDLALEKIFPKDFLKVLAKELAVGFVNGMVLGIEIGFVAYFWKGIPFLGLVVAAGLWINTILSVCIGGVVPLLLKRFRVDPAVASGPILTTVTDMMGFFIVLSLTSRFIDYLV
ncbi:MAG: magnesium transporter [Elusimicrobia bacterium RIFCSPLOWO2_01_FULL_64_13]|nr:MAG: magnesium transporter [Elusimicrobia bacterium RIFCSPHIGHO2_01_FULL_64_10]OGR94559.1 MAG: magnesium transporter [Elusimicrobia bacterium RIFCSPLOWO2_01_FULL_64_13]